MTLHNGVIWGINTLTIIWSHFSLFLMLIMVLFLLQRGVFKLSANMLGGRAIYISAWLGTPIHELSHALFCILFGHKVKRIVLFNPDMQGTLGYVTHAYNNRNLWHIMGNFFIGIAPLLGGLLGLYAVTLWLLPDPSILFSLLKQAVFDDAASIQVTHLVHLFDGIVDVLMNAYKTSPWQVIVWGYGCAAISLHLSPSKEDLKGAWVGFSVFLMLCLILSFVMSLLEVNFNLHLNQFGISDVISNLAGNINMMSMLYVIGIVLASLLLCFLLCCKMLTMLVRSF